MGIIYNSKEGETPLDDLSGLKIKIPNITRNQLDVLEAENIQKAISKYLLSKRHKTINFNPSFFSTLHKEMFGTVWSWAGTYRTSDTNIGSPKQSIAQDLLILSKDLEYWDKSLDSAVRLHHRAVQIHPFAGGNGRWSRFLSALWLRQNCNQFIFWPEGMDKESPIRQEYLSALRTADGLNYEPLLNLHQTYVRNI
jgi:Fic-DOC domain mobile mystery protein B